MKKNVTNAGHPEIPVTGLVGKKILFAAFPADGHFNPLTGLAAYLKDIGCDVRWYTSTKYADKLERMGIPLFPLQTAKDISELERMFPERDAIKGQIAKLKFDLINAFVLRAPEYFADIKALYEEFPFDVMVADCAFTGIPFVTDLMKIPVISIGIAPLMETSKDLPPVGLGMTPSYTWFGKLKQSILRFACNQMLFREPNKVMNRVLANYSIDNMNTHVFDLNVKKATLLLQSGTPGFEYRRSDLGKNIRYIGALLPYESKKNDRSPWFNEKLNRFDKVVIVTQGTVEKNVEKIIVPTLEAFKDTDVLVIATTGGSQTQELRERYKHNNIIIEDFIPFGDIMPYADVYVTNGGYGGVMLGIENQLPMVVAGVHEGKNEINARIGYFKLGVNLATELPTAEQMKTAVTRILRDESFKTNVVRLEQEFRQYRPQELCAKYIREVLQKSGSVQALVASR